jgi:guanine deaminase
MMHEVFLRRAVNLASDNVMIGGGPFGALIVSGEKIIAASGNRVTLDVDPTAHAEILAIRKACQLLNKHHLTGCMLYASCEPCPMCLGAIYWARLDKVYFACNRKDAEQAGFDDGLIYQEIALPPEQRQIPMQSIVMPDAQEPFTVWNRKADKVLY